MPETAIVVGHGIGMLPRYHELWQAGFIDMEAEPTVVRDEVATGLLDGQKGLGHYVSTQAMKACIARQRRSASAWSPSATPVTTALPPTIR